MANESNLTPFTGADDPRRSNGRPKGVKNWASIVEDVLHDEKIFKAVTKGKKNLPEWVKQSKNRNFARAVAIAMLVKALNGDTKAAEWARRTAYGDKQVHEFVDDPVEAILVRFGLTGEVGDSAGQTKKIKKTTP